MQLCPNCGANNKDAAKFCNACGQRMAISLALGRHAQGPLPDHASDGQGMGC